MYENVIYQRMRHILMSYRTSWGGTLSKFYEWGDLASDIEAITDVIIPRNSLENFVRGLKSRDSDAQARYSIPAPDRIEAIIKFLTEPTSKGWFCSKTTLLQSIELTAPLIMQDYVGGVDKTDSLAKKLSLIAQSSWCTELDECRHTRSLGQIEINFLVVLGNGALLVDVVKSIGIGEDRSAHVGPSKEKPHLYHGFATLSREEALLIFSKHFRHKSNLLFVMVGWTEFNPENPLDCMALIEHDLLRSTVEIDTALDGAWIADKIMLADRVRVFRKMIS